MMNASILSSEYYFGMREGVRRFAHRRAGVQYVGTSGKTLKEALAEVEKEEANEKKLCVGGSGGGATV
ncbi:hypothetical protein LCGC14_2964130 [marine sediment metagenome]|uniref:Uncharacterized protein n=1 Tax=marine sediment metagenome TaxID=412755 RepID=A0A0F8XBD4_9ZZZZ